MKSHGSKHTVSRLSNRENFEKKKTLLNLK